MTFVGSATAIDHDAVLGLRTGTAPVLAREVLREAAGEHRGRRRARAARGTRGRTARPGPARGRGAVIQPRSTTISPIALPGLAPLARERVAELIRRDQPVAEEHVAETEPGDVCRFHVPPIDKNRLEKLKAVVQRVAEARVRVGGEIVGEIGRGLLVLLGVARGDGPRRPSGWPARSRGCGSSRTPTGQFDRSVRRRGRVGAGREPVHAARGYDAKGNRPELHARQRARSRPSRSTRRSAPRCAAAASPWRRASSARGWRSSSSTTGRSRSCSTPR